MKREREARKQAGRQIDWFRFDWRNLTQKRESSFFYFFFP